MSLEPPKKLFTFLELSKRAARFQNAQEFKNYSLRMFDSYQKLMFANVLAWWLLSDIAI
jgi:hypothetical protein